MCNRPSTAFFPFKDPNAWSASATSASTLAMQHSAASPSLVSSVGAGRRCRILHCIKGGARSLVVLLVPLSAVGLFCTLALCVCLSAPVSCPDPFHSGGQSVAPMTACSACALFSFRPNLRPVKCVALPTPSCRQAAPTGLALRMELRLCRFLANKYLPCATSRS